MLKAVYSITPRASDYIIEHKKSAFQNQVVRIQQIRQSMFYNAKEDVMLMKNKNFVG